MGGGGGGVFFFLMIRRPPRSTQSRSSAASDVYKRQDNYPTIKSLNLINTSRGISPNSDCYVDEKDGYALVIKAGSSISTVSYTHLRAHETRHDLVCRLLLEKKKKKAELSYTVFCLKKNKQLVRCRLHGTKTMIQ